MIAKTICREGRLYLLAARADLDVAVVRRVVCGAWWPREQADTFTRGDIPTAAELVRRIAAGARLVA